MKLMQISADLADINYERNQAWQSKPSPKQGLTAGLMFDGEVYRGFREEAFTKDHIKYLQKNVFILSGLYGILSPTDIIMPYRLEMGTPLQVNQNKNLYEFWQNKLTSYVNQYTKQGELLLNLSSKEYMRSLNSQKLHGQLIDFKFKDYREGKLKQITVYMKKARGEMANWCIVNNAKHIDDLKRFDRMNYAYDDNLSTQNTLVYTR